MSLLYRAEQPYQHATYHTNMLLAERAWSKTDLLNSTDDLTVESLQSFIPFLFSQLHLEFLFHGNLTKQVDFWSSSLSLSPPEISLNN
jgi:insulysin